MKMEIADTADGLVNVTLVGRLDTPAVERIEPHLVASIVPRGARAIVDLSRLEFVSSMGLRVISPETTASWFFTLRSRG